MSFFEVEFPQQGLAYQRLGGPGFNTAITATQSGQEQRNRNWANSRRKYSGGLIGTNDMSFAAKIAIIDQVYTFHDLVGGKADPFRFFDELDCQAAGEPMVVVPATSNLQWQLSRTRSLGGRTSVRSITKPITSSVVDYRGNALADSVTIHHTGGTLTSVDHTTGIATFSVAPSGTPTADFSYHIPVRFDSDDFEPQIERSGKGSRLIKWNSLLLIEVRPPNY